MPSANQIADFLNQLYLKLEMINHSFKHRDLIQETQKMVCKF